MDGIDLKALAAPFAADDIGWKPQSVKGNRALAIAYIDARNVMDRLDSVVGTENWQDEYTPLPEGSVICKLSLRVGGEWVAKMDVGSPSEQPDGGDRMKAAVSDALKRAAVKFGIGRYLYSLPHQWCDYDPVKRQFLSTPRLPDWAIPGWKKPVPKEPAIADKPAPVDDARMLEKQWAIELEQCDTLQELSGAWGALEKDKRLTFEQRKKLATLKDARKDDLAAVGAGAK